MLRMRRQLLMDCDGFNLLIFMMYAQHRLSSWKAISCSCDLAQLRDMDSRKCIDFVKN